MKTLEIKPKAWEFNWQLGHEEAWYECPFCKGNTYWDYIHTGKMHIGCKHVVDWDDNAGTVTFSEDVQ